MTDARTLSRVITLGLPILGMSIGGGWVAEGIGSHLTALAPAWKLTIGALTFFSCALWAYQKGREYLPIRVLERRRTPQPRSVLILPVSSPNFEWHGATTIHERRTGKTIELTKNLEKDSQKAEINWNWQQLLRAIKPHTPHLHHIHLLGSPGKRGSHQHLAKCKNFLKSYLNPTCHIDIHPDPVDFEDIDTLRKTLDQIIQRLTRHHQEQDILLDSTGGTKTTSIAIALYTSHRPKLQFQYVNNEGEILTFNVLNMREGELG